MMFRLAISGYRGFNDYNFLAGRLDRLLESRMPDVLILHGDARGADSCADVYARDRDLWVVRFPAKWEQYGRRAGIIRNAELIGNADALVAFLDQRSIGTRDAIDRAIKIGIPVVVYSVELDHGGYVVSVEISNFNMDSYR